MKLYLWCFSLLALVSVVPPAMAEDTNHNPAADTNRMAALQNYFLGLKLIEGLKYQRGVINLPGGMATINLPTNLCYLSPDDADTVLMKIWHNPMPPKTLGMLLPVGKPPSDPDCWAFTITSTDDGHVKDDDAGTINYDNLLKQMQEGARAENQQRIAHGVPAVELAGWAVPPHYDATAHTLDWAQELKFSAGTGSNSATSTALGYDIRILGRHSVLALRSAASLSQLSEIREATPQLLAAVNFTAGNRYADFDPKADKVAPYGIPTLITGELVAKPDNSKMFLVGLLVGIVAFLAVLRVRRNATPRQNPVAQP